MGEDFEALLAAVRGGGLTGIPAVHGLQRLTAVIPPLSRDRSASRPAIRLCGDLTQTGTLAPAACAGRQTALDPMTEQPGPRTHGHGASLHAGRTPNGCLRDHSASHAGDNHDP